MDLKLAVAMATIGAPMAVGFLEELKRGQELYQVLWALVLDRLFKQIKLYQVQLYVMKVN